ncbi:hypothetical protein KAR91_47010 [Candidatus Pacearchaeota archaeon]|nr:hypothetical protein [Candidatus Pacearchaeota archaeon]
MNKQIKVDLAECPEIICTICKNKLWTPIFILKKVSAIQAAQLQDQILPVQMWKCLECQSLFDGHKIHENKGYRKRLTDTDTEISMYRQCQGKDM